MVQCICDQHLWGTRHVLLLVQGDSKQTGTFEIDPSMSTIIKIVKLKVIQLQSNICTYLNSMKNIIFGSKSGLLDWFLKVPTT